MENLPLLLQDALKKIIDAEGFVKYNLDKVQFDAICGNYMSELLEINVKGKTEICEKEINLFIKKKIVLDKMNFVSVDNFFVNEEFFYNDLSKIFTYLQDQARVPLDMRFKTAKSYTGTNTDVIILENLTKKNFKPYKRMDEIPLRSAELVVEELAKLHSLSFVLEKTMPEYFDRNIKPKELLLNYDEDWKRYIQNVITYMANMYKDNYDIKHRIENFLPKVLTKFPQYNSSKIPFKCSLSHGDFRMHNVLIREQDGEPVEAVIVDFQAINYGCPIRDFFGFIYTSTDQTLRKKNLNHLKEFYFSSLSRFLKYFDVNVESVFPRREFEKIYSEWTDYGLMIAILMSTFIFAPEDGVGLEEIGLSDMPFNFSERANEIIRGWVEDFVQLGVL